MKDKNEKNTEKVRESITSHAEGCKWYYYPFRIDLLSSCRGLRHG